MEAGLINPDVSRYVRPNPSQSTRGGASPKGTRRKRSPLPRNTLSAEGLGGDPIQPAPLRIAVVDRDSGFLLVLAKRLDGLEWEHRVLAPTVPTKRIAAMRLDALIVDPAVLGPRCWAWLERLCRARPRFRIVICTSTSTVTERVRALEMGVDDWLSKPCHPEELVARIEAVVGHRRRPERNLEPTKIGEVEIRPDQYQAFVAGRSLDLTRREYELIELLAGAGNDVFERELIFQRLWGPAMIRNDRTVDVFVHKLRRKLERASPGWRYIHTHWGIGYRLAPEPIHAACATPLELEREPEPVRDNVSTRLAA